MNCHQRSFVLFTQAQAHLSSNDSLFPYRIIQSTEWQPVKSTLQALMSLLCTKTRVGHGAHTRAQPADMHVPSVDTSGFPNIVFNMIPAVRDGSSDSPHDGDSDATLSPQRLSQPRCDSRCEINTSLHVESQDLGETDTLRDSIVIPAATSTRLQTPGEHKILLSALQQTALSYPWSASASAMVKLLGDWYCNPSASSLSNDDGTHTHAMQAAQLRNAIRDVQAGKVCFTIRAWKFPVAMAWFRGRVSTVQLMQASLPFAVGMGAVASSSSMKEWFVWRLPGISMEEQALAQLCMAQLLIRCQLGEDMAADVQPEPDSDSATVSM